MKEDIYIFGHQNPDTDSICSSISYAYLKNQMGYENAKPYRLGDINNETKFVLDYFDVEEPTFLDDIKLKIKDLSLYSPITMKSNNPVKKAWNILKKYHGPRIIPILNDDGSIEGVISSGNLANLFMDNIDNNISSKYEILFDNLVDIIDGTVVKDNYPHEKIEGGIFIASSLPANYKPSDKDIIIAGDNQTVQELSKTVKCGCIFTVGDAYIDSPNNSLSPIVTSPYSLIKTINLIHQAVSISSIMKKDDLIVISGDSDVEDTLEIMKMSSYRNFPVVDEQGFLQGIVSRRHFIELNRKKVILMDHNEKKQSVDGLEKAEIIEIIDHHRIADIQTSEPLFIRAEPVGCTATIVYKLYKENGFTPPKHIAGLLLSAIISDTLMFSSPTCTPDDRHAVKSLSEIAEVDVEKYGIEMFNAGTHFEDFTVDEILSIDRKRFSIGKNKLYISQINALDFTYLSTLEEEFYKCMDEFCEEKKCDFALLMITDISSNGSEILVRGKNKALAMKAFNINDNDSSIFLQGVVSRKKQMIPKLSLAAQ